MKKSSILRYIFKRIKCEHQYVAVNDGYSYFGKDHVSYRCTKCGKIKY